MSALKCFNGNIHKADYLVEIFNKSDVYDCVETVRWCTCCGAVVIDSGMDGRINPGKMKWPTSATLIQGESNYT